MSSSAINAAVSRSSSMQRILFFRASAMHRSRLWENAQMDVAVKYHKIRFIPRIQRIIIHHRRLDGFANVTVDHEATRFDQISPRYRLPFLLPAGDRPWLVQPFAPEQLQQGFREYRRPVAAEHACSRRS